MHGVVAHCKASAGLNVTWPDFVMQAIAVDTSDPSARK